VKFSVNWNQKEIVVGTFHEGSVTIQASRNAISSSSHIEANSLGASEVIYEVGGKASDMVW
jgi:hypothetical protein